MNTNKQISRILLRKEVQWICLFLVILFVYFRVFTFDFNLDDYIITDTLKGKVNRLSDLYDLFGLSYNHTDYRPLVFLSFGIEQLIFGEIRPDISHGVNLCLFFLICISGLTLLKKMVGKDYELLSFAAILLFAIHPINTEVVCSIKCRDNLLSMFFSLQASILLLHFLQSTNRKYFFLVLSAILFILSLWSKKDAAGFLIFNAVYILFYQNEKKILHFILYFIVFILTLTSIEKIQGILLSGPNPEVLTGKVTFTENPLSVAFTFTNSCIALINTIFFYFTRLIPVSGYRYYYGYHYLDILSVQSISFFGGLLILICFVVLFIIAFKNRDKLMVVSIMATFILALYALNFFTPVAGIIADRYLFMANLFFCLLFVSLFKKILLSISNSPFVHYTLISVIGILFITLSFIRAQAWKDFKTLVDTDAPKLYSSYEAMRIAAGAYYSEFEQTNDTALKKQYLNTSILYAEKGVTAYPKNSLLYLFLGQYYFKAGRTNDAVQSFKNALKNDSSLTEGYIYLGDAYYSLKAADSAISCYNKALERLPRSQTIINNISTVYYELKQKEECLKFNNDLINRDSTLFPAYENLGYYYLNEQDTMKANHYFKKAIQFGLNEQSVPVKL
ncbi:MAG: hypothetical protein U0T77_09240 [Chitinophagales bacterium]